MHKEVKFNGPSGFKTALLSFNFHNSGNFHPNEKNKISKSKLWSHLIKTKNISEIKPKAFVLVLINAGPFLGHPVFKGDLETYQFLMGLWQLLASSFE